MPNLYAFEEQEFFSKYLYMAKDCDLPVNYHIVEHLFVAAFFYSNMSTNSWQSVSQTSHIAFIMLA